MRESRAHQLAKGHPSNGLKQAGGLMVNYLYDLDAVETNHEAYANHGKVAASQAVQSS